jgi:flagellar biosynthetic protein FlhB
MADKQEQGSEEATPFKLREAQKRGSVAKSMEVNSFAAIAVLAAVVAFWGRSIARDHVVLARQIMEFAGRLDFSAPTIVAWLGKVGWVAVVTVLPLFVLLIVLGLLSSLLQTGPVFSAVPLKPDFNRLNPVEGLQRLFSKKIIFETLKGVLKMALLGTALYLVLVHSLETFTVINQVDPRGLLPVLLSQAMHVIGALLPIVALIAFADFVYTRWDFQGRMKMSRRELREEVKQREGDPRIKARVRELRQEMLKRGKALKRVGDADVLITNPSHLAVALLYRKGEMSAPRVVAKGAGELAAAMRMLARKRGVPIVENRALARALFRSADIDRSIPETLYQEVARVLAWIYATRPPVAGAQARPC